MNHSFPFRQPWLAGALAILLAGAAFLAVSLLMPSRPPAMVEVVIAATGTSVEQNGRLTPTPVSPSQGTVIATQFEPVSETPSSTSAPGEASADPPATPATPSPSLTPTLSCDRAAAGNPIDVTVPDDSEVMPGEPLTKIWRLMNTGSCTWTNDYAARFFSGDSMSAPQVVFFGKEVPPGQEVEIAVDMVAPAEPGKYQGNWKLSNPAGALFGIGPRGDAPFWVRITVMRISTPTFTPTHTSTPTTTPTLEVTPTATSSPTPLVQSSGSLVLGLDQTLDLDSGQVNPSQGQDLAYLLQAPYHQLAPQSEALLGVYGAEEPSQDACTAASMSPAPIALESLSPGAYLCYQTGDELPGWLRYELMNANDASVSLSFRTWGNP